MRSAFIHAAAGALIIGLGSAVQAQGGRNWVDPPADLSASKETAPPAEAKPALPEPKVSLGKVPEGKTGESRETSSAQTSVGAASETPSRSKKTAAKAKRSREAQARPSRQRSAAIPARRLAERRYSVAEPEAQTETYPQASRYEMMRLRTYELPDGRRIQVLTRPRAEPPRYQSYSYPAYGYYR